MLAATKIKMSGSEKKNKKKTGTHTMYDISSIKCVTRKIFVVVVQKNGKEMTIKCAARP